TEPLTFAVLVFPGFPMMAFSSVIEPLRAAPCPSSPSSIGGEVSSEARRSGGRPSPRALRSLARQIVPVLRRLRVCERLPPLRLGFAEPPLSPPEGKERSQGRAMRGNAEVAS
ncbi:hypothetical protein EN989_30500, partial [Mesorhizobium sp. M7A.F.Ca.CA.002.12.1.1]